MSNGAILVIAIAATGILMMRFRKRWLAKINVAFTNRITSLFAGWLPGFGILTHVGRKSGKIYRTPVNVFRAPNGFIIALTYSSQWELTAMTILIRSTGVIFDRLDVKRMDRRNIRNTLADTAAI